MCLLLKIHVTPFIYLQQSPPSSSSSWAAVSLPPHSFPEAPPNLPPPTLLPFQQGIALAYLPPRYSVLFMLSPHPPTTHPLPLYTLFTLILHPSTHSKTWLSRTSYYRVKCSIIIIINWCASPIWTKLASLYSLRVPSQLIDVHNAFPHQSSVDDSHASLNTAPQPRTALHSITILLHVTPTAFASASLLKHGKFVSNIAGQPTFAGYPTPRMNPSHQILHTHAKTLCRLNNL